MLGLSWGQEGSEGGGGNQVFFFILHVTVLCFVFVI